MCAKLESLRQRATQLHRAIRYYRVLALTHAGEERGGCAPGRSDYETLFQRRLHCLSTAIETHLAGHGCGD
ncbi:MAG: hypothetical protein ACE14L_05145 [Terriglobales bacterium]